MRQKKSYRNDIIRGATLVLALLIFFVGPYFTQHDTADDAAKLVHRIMVEKKIALPMRMEIIEQLQSDERYIREHANNIGILGVNTSAINWFAFLVVLVGFGLPVLTKYIENKKAA